VATGTVQAGMVTPSFDQLAPAAKTIWNDPKLALTYLLLFLVGSLASAWIVQGIWNELRESFTRMPRLSYARALAVVGLWGGFFVLVLLMISAAREFLTPGAWERQGSSYRLKAAQAFDDAMLDRRRRRDHLERLRTALWVHAESHNGQFPASREDLEAATDIWQIPGTSDTRYVYVPGEAPGRGSRPLVYEPDILGPRQPDILGPRRLVLLTNGDIREPYLQDLEPELLGRVEK
jgi:hypothetical protein